MSGPWNEMAPSVQAKALVEGLARFDEWRQGVVSLLAGEGVMSRTARSVLSSDVASRLSEGLPGHREPSLPSAVHSWPDEAERLIESTAAALFNARFIEWRPTSNTMANAVAMHALAEPGDLIAVQAMGAGANVSYQSKALAGLLGLTTMSLPATGEFEIDARSAAEAITDRRPRLVVIGGSKVLFPYPLQDIRDAADAVGARVLFDAAHLGPFIAAGTFPHPLKNGAHAMTTGTHKLMGGPVGGLVVTDDPAIAERIRASAYPRFLQTRDLNKYAAGAIALLELLEHRHEYAATMLANARALGDALADRGFRLMGSARGYTCTHMLFARATDIAPEIARRCEHNGILLTHTAAAAPDEGQRVLRISIADVTRHGMREPEMVHIARLIYAAGCERADVRGEVRALAHGFPRVGFSFDA